MEKKKRVNKQSKMKNNQNHYWNCKVLIVKSNQKLIQNYKQKLIKDIEKKNIQQHGTTFRDWIFKQIKQKKRRKNLNKIKAIN